MAFCRYEKTITTYLLLQLPDPDINTFFIL